MLPIIARPPTAERRGINMLDEIQIYNPVSKSYINIGQIVNDVEIGWEDPLIKRRNRKRTLSILADPGPDSNAFVLHAKVREPVEAVELPTGYSLQWGGEYEAQQKANKAVFSFVPLGILMMFIINIIMFNSIKQTLVIWLTIPLAIIGVGYGPLIMGPPSASPPYWQCSASWVCRSKMVSSWSKR